MCGRFTSYLSPEILTTIYGVNMPSACLSVGCRTAPEGYKMMWWLLIFDASL